ncbi:cell wall-binding repeat-containing protein [Leifsonia shinshuensis]|uniref:cell wall-binding repeat-containing protein n=1 Tax=Leifsonia shinshuensis TaxID=150026 RepID=UPI0028582F6C|nr:cell wall-binding repeat-containing protein [Leifsonia shinshuensis]MDR6973245.1 putative cell wall-binding protein [Leifsonia shinshuensis]
MTPPRHRFRLLTAALSVLAVVLVGSLTAPGPSAQAASGSDFQAGYIISDSNFYNGGAADAGSIQNFLNAQVPACRAGYTCLKDYRETTYSRAADAMCAAYTGAAGETAAAIIAKVGAACSISQKVLLVLLEKEQSLVTDTWPTTGQYQKATGFACPDTGPCDPQTLGFYNQVYKAAWQFKRYGNPPGTSSYFTWIPVGQVSAIRYSPNAACGAANVLVRNAATAALYYYTPYQPNPAALANLYGTGDGCSAYGNRNFWRLYTDWFGSATSGVPPIGNFEAANLQATAFAIGGWALDQTLASTSISVRITWKTPAGTTTTTVAANGSRPDIANAYPNAGAAHGFSASVPRTGDGQYTACVTALPASGNPSGPTDLGCRAQFYSSALGGAPGAYRVQGSDRYATSVAVSQAAYPTPGVPVVYVASGQGYADAIAASAAAAAQKGPLLLTTGGDVPAGVLAEVKRLTPAKIVVVGGPNVIADAVLAKLATVQPNVVRIAGFDRFETSRQLAKYAFPGATAAYFAGGLNFPDALSAASAASAGGQPVLLVSGFGPADAATAGFVSAAKLTSATVVGGSAIVAPSFDTSLRSAGVAVTRVGGADRYDTSHLVNSQRFASAGTVFVASGIDFPDALSAAAMAGAAKAPLYLSPSWCLPRSVGDDIVKMKASKVYFVGGPAALTGAVTGYIAC